MVTEFTGRIMIFQQLAVIVLRRQQVTDEGTGVQDLVVMSPPAYSARLNTLNIVWIRVIAIGDRNPNAAAMSKIDTGSPQEIFELLDCQMFNDMFSEYSFD